MRVFRLAFSAVLCFLPIMVSAAEPVLSVTLVPASAEIVPAGFDLSKPIYRFEVAAVGEGKTIIISSHVLVQAGSTERLRAGRLEGPAVGGTIAVNPNGIATYEAVLSRPRQPEQTARGTVALAWPNPLPAASLRTQPTQVVPPVE
jgi:hypothetical protein